METVSLLSKPHYLTLQKAPLSTEFLLFPVLLHTIPRHFHLAHFLSIKNRFEQARQKYPRRHGSTQRRKHVTTVCLSHSTPSRLFFSFFFFHTAISGFIFSFFPPLALSVCLISTFYSSQIPPHFLPSQWLLRAKLKWNRPISSHVVCIFTLFEMFYCLQLPHTSRITLPILCTSDFSWLMLATLTLGMSSIHNDPAKIPNTFQALLSRLVYIYTGCPRRNVPDFGRVFFMVKYTYITQNTYV
jgi:hypothetical protein